MGLLGCFHELGAPFHGALVTRGPAFGVHVGTPDLWKLPLQEDVATVDSGFLKMLLLAKCVSLQRLGALFRSPYNKDHNILGSVLGPLFMETSISYICPASPDLLVVGDFCRRGPNIPTCVF